MTRSAIHTVVVTYNRKFLLAKCLDALEEQTFRPDEIIIIDNASTDGTKDYLALRKKLRNTILHVYRLEENLGGAGGFAKGLRLATNNGADWVWMMDDDAVPHPTALQELFHISTEPYNIYGSVAFNGSNTAWPVTPAEHCAAAIDDLGAIPDRLEVESIPFLGFLIHRDMVQRIGLPDAGYFIAADDIEYCLRAKRAGARLILASRSRIKHPKTQRETVHLLGHEVVYLSLPPWKRYYDTRNRLLNARKYYGRRLFTEVLPGSFIRLIAALIREPRKGAQLWAWCCGIFDGLLGIKGRRHMKWGIRP